MILSLLLIYLKQNEEKWKLILNCHSLTKVYRNMFCSTTKLPELHYIIYTCTFVAKIFVCFEGMHVHASLRRPTCMLLAVIHVGVYSLQVDTCTMSCQGLI